MFDALYYPILRAKQGEIEALGHLSPAARAIIRPTLDLPMSHKKQSLAEHFGDVLFQVKKSWGNQHPLYLDLSRYRPDIAIGRDTAVEWLFGRARQLGLLAVPVAGPEVVRGPGTAYLEAVARILRRDGRGVALRIYGPELRPVGQLISSLSQLLETLGVRPEATDLFLDLGALDNFGHKKLAGHQLEDGVSGLVAEMWAVLNTVSSMGFRCIVFQASNLPDKVPPRFNDSCMVVPRPELQVWQQLIARGAGQLLRFGDYSIVHPRQIDSDKPVVPPPRVRFATHDGYRLYRAEVDQARSLARRVCEDPAYYAAGDSWGMQEVRASAGGFGGPGAGPQWVARDTNHHLECTAGLVRQALMRAGRLHELSLAPAMREPWLQELLQ